jgi:hypothetical protein
MHALWNNRATKRLKDVCVSLMLVVAAQGWAEDLESAQPPHERRIV